MYLSFLKNEIQKSIREVKYIHKNKNILMMNYKRLNLVYSKRIRYNTFWNNQTLNLAFFMEDHWPLFFSILHTINKSLDPWSSCSLHLTFNFITFVPLITFFENNFNEIKIFYYDCRDNYQMFMESKKE